MSLVDPKSRLPKGLSATEVLASRQRHGDNVLTAPPRRSLLSQLLEKFADPLIRILMVVLLLAMAIAVYECWWLERGLKAFVEPIGVLVAIVLATFVGFAVEVNANKKFELLNKTNDDIPVRVRRGGKMTQVPRRDVVVGDIVLLETGEKIPADGDLLRGINLMVNESSLTGEPSAHKWSEPEQVAAHEGKTTYPVNRLLRGSNVIEGNAVMRVATVGNDTEYGHVYQQSQIETDVKTPLMLQFDRLGKLIARFSYVMAAFIIVGRMVVFCLDDVSYSSVETVRYIIDTVMLAVTLIVVSVPEGLPMSVTLSLALSMRRMLKTNNLVRKMHACETMGAATVICTDKTGTLTQNSMTVFATHFDGIDDQVDDLVVASMAVNSTAHLDTSRERPRVLGNPTEGALLLWLRDNGVDYEQWRERCRVEAMMPFDTERKYMASLIEDTATQQRWLLVKGAPEIVAAMCVPQSDEATTERRRLLKEYQRKAMRTLAFAVKRVTDDHPVTEGGRLMVPQGLDLLGFVAISDPVRDDVPQAIADCHRAGIEVKIVTGDAPETACEVARQVGVLPENGQQVDMVIEGRDFALLPDDEAAQLAMSLRVMARARPTDKARLVGLLQQQGQVVAVTGDGTNDAPALNAAQVGLSMGSGTSVAKEASDITILDDSFASINKAVLWGRSLYRNIQRFIMFQLVVNVCACLVVGVCSFFNRQSPLTVTQMLWVNLIMDTFAALALASLPPNSIVMRQPPRPVGSNIITPPMTRFIVIMGLLFSIVMGGLFYYLHSNAATGYGSFLGSEITPNEVAVFFTTFVFLQFWNMFNVRAYMTGHSAFHNIGGSLLFFAILAVIAVGQVAIVEWASPVFNCAPMTLGQWLSIVGSTSLVMVAGELWRLR